MRILYLLMVAVGIFGALGCGQRAAPSAAPAAAAVVPLPPSATHDLAALPVLRMERGDSQRDAVALPAGVVRLDLDAGADAAQLRFWVIAEEAAPVEIGVYQEGRAVALPPAVEATTWSHRAAEVQPGKAISLVLRSAQPFHLAECRVVAKLPPKPDVIVYLIDTLRRDHLGCYNYPLETSPNIDAFAQDATLFRDLTPMSSWTRPSVASLLTGTMDYTHHVLGREDRLPAGLPSLARTLGAAGWRTHALMVNPVAGSSFGFGGDFHWHEEFWRHNRKVDWPDDTKAADRAVASIAESGGEPLFLYLHTMAPHRDYTPAPGYAERFMPDRFVGTAQQVRTFRDMALYDAEIRFSDDQFARVIAALKQAGRYDNALIVLLADHGEQFMEHGEMAHAASLHFAELGVPLLVKLPGNVRTALPRREPVAMADIAPTILRALGLEVPPAMEGRSLMPMIVPGEVILPKPTFARLRFGDKHFYMAQTLTHKYLYDVVRGEATWYRREEDPEEQFPLRVAPPGAEGLREFAEEMAAKPVPAPGTTSAPLTEKESRDLDALGYF